MKKFLMAVALTAGIAVSSAAPAQDSAYTQGNYWQVQGIFVQDGQFENYMDYIASTYRRSQDFARARGWITGYRILGNVNRRENEPDLYLITEFRQPATQAESAERERLLNAHMEQTTHQADEGSGRRVTMRRLGSNLLLQELTLRPAR